MVELIEAESETLLSQIHKLINYIWKKEELCDQWKKPVVVPVSKKGTETDCCNSHWIALLSISYEILSYILLSVLSPYMDAVNGDNHCWF
jgi:hypothetical protein